MMAETNWIDFFVALTPVAQSLIWALIVVFLAATFREPIKVLIRTFIDRLKQGDKVAIGSISIESGSRQEREHRMVESIKEDLKREMAINAETNGDTLPAMSVDEFSERLDRLDHRYIELVFLAAAFKTKENQDVLISMYLTGWVTVSGFLNEVYNFARDSGVDLPMWTYGTYWRFRNERTGSILEKVGDSQKDVSPFERLKIQPGDRLIAERI